MVGMIPRQTVNMTDVAQRCGVSIASVSRALRGEPGVSPATRDRIMLAARELAYVVSPEASRLSGGSTGRVGVVVPRIDAWFYATVLAGVAGEFDAVGVDLVLCTLPDSSARHRFFEALPLRRKVDAVIIVSVPCPRGNAPAWTNWACRPFRSGATTRLGAGPGSASTTNWPRRRRWDTCCESATATSP